jgi:adenylate kinase
MRAWRLVFLGPPGTGKGTQAQRLAQRLGLVQLSSGDVLRKEVKDNTPIGQQAFQFMKAGTLVPDEVITGVMLAAIDRLPAGTGFILDGFPRTVPQAEALDAGLERRGLAIDAVLDFRLDDAEIIRRIVTRRICSECGATYNTEFMPPKLPGVCDRCGGQVVQRVDDREDVVATRLSAYRAQTAPLIGYYARRGYLHAIDAAVGADEVEKAVARVLEKLGGPV